MSCCSHTGPLTLVQSLVGFQAGGLWLLPSPSALRFLAGLSLLLTGNSSTYKVTAGAYDAGAEGLRMRTEQEA